MCQPQLQAMYPNCPVARARAGMQSTASSLKFKTIQTLDGDVTGPEVRSRLLVSPETGLVSVVCSKER